MKRVLAIGALVVACGRTTRDADESGGSSGAVETAGAASGGVAAGGAGRVTIGSAAGEGGAPACVAEGTQPLAALMPACGEGCLRTCTFVVRLDHGSLEPLGWSAACGITEAAVDEETARRTALAATGYGSSSATVLPSSGYIFVFAEEPLDFGGLAIVASLTDQALFGGSVVWDGTGSISYPETWEPPDRLGRGCGFEGVELPSDPEPRAAAERVGQTALGQVFYGSISSVDVVLYTPSVGEIDYSVAEWLVLVTGFGMPGV